MSKTETKIELLELNKEEMLQFIELLEKDLIPAMNKHRSVRWSDKYTLEDITEIKLDGNHLLRKRFCIAFQNDESQQMSFVLNFDKVTPKERDAYKQIALSIWYYQDKLFFKEVKTDVSSVLSRVKSSNSETDTNPEF